MPLRVSFLALLPIQQLMLPTLCVMSIHRMRAVNSRASTLLQSKQESVVASPFAALRITHARKYDADSYLQRDSASKTQNATASCSAVMS